MEKKAYRFETLALHAGQVPDPSNLSRGVPVHRTSSFVFKNTAHAADLFALKEPGNIYTRIMNPTQDVLEQRVAALEGGAAALAVASGTSAVFYAIINLAKAGDEIVSTNNLYGGTYTMFEAILPQFGITVKFTENNDFKAIRKAIGPKTRAVYIEAVGNPSLDIADIRSAADLAHENNIPLIVDSTFATPYLLRPIEQGADIVIHSLTKWLGGHGAAIGGIVVDSGKFDWTDPKFTLFNEPDPNYHGLRWAHDLGAQSSLAYILRMRTVPLRNLGACISPDNAWIFLQGIETLPLRMERHCANALKVAEFLKKDNRVAWVRYPGLPDDPSNKTAKKYLTKGFGGMVVFGVKGGYEAAVKLIDNIKLFSHLANVGDAKSLILHPASTSHSQLSEEQQKEGGLTPDLIRLSIGLEHSDDIIGALDEALAASAEQPAAHRPRAGHAGPVQPASRIGVSEEYLIRLFKSHMRMTPLQYANRLRIEAASGLIISTDKSIGEISDHFGFVNQFHFSRIFKKCTGLSPSAYRQSYSQIVDLSPPDIPGSRQTSRQISQYATIMYGQ